VPKYEETIIEPVIPEEEEEEEDEENRLCSECWQRPADKKVTSYGNPDGILRISKYCDYCIETEFPHFKSSLA
jgi:hypothetical protein